MTATHGRCAYCRVALRWWQDTYCRACRKAIHSLLHPMPYAPNSRRYAAPDHWNWHR